MLLEAFEILQSGGQDENAFVTDFGLYKLVYILCVYLPIILSTFVLSQEYLGDKVACFAPDNFTDPQAAALNEYCWTNGYWVSEGVPLVKSLYTQPHRFYPLYLPIQAISFMSPIVFWNILTKSHLLAVLRGTEEFLEDLLKLVDRDNEEAESKVAAKCRELLRQFHDTCVNAARVSNLARIAIVRVAYEFCLMTFTLFMQFVIYNHKVKHYHCSLPQLGAPDLLCTVPILDLLDIVWSLNVSALFLAYVINAYMIFKLYNMHFSSFQPMFYNNLPYGDTDDFNERVTWDSVWTKDSYRLLTRIFMENNSIMTKTYVLMAIKPGDMTTVLGVPKRGVGSENDAALLGEKVYEYGVDIGPDSVGFQNNGYDETDKIDDDMNNIDNEVDKTEENKQLLENNSDNDTGQDVRMRSSYVTEH